MTGLAGSLMLWGNNYTLCKAYLWVFNSLATQETLAGTDSKIMTEMPQVLGVWLIRDVHWDLQD